MLQHAAHSSCCHVTVNDDDRSPDTGGDCSTATFATAFKEMLRAINDDVSIIEALPFPMATAPRSPKIGVLRKAHPCGNLVMDFPGEDPVSLDDNDEE
uniref:Uncharacterized protein n=1 Tax=Romanomermis culicivorax TaxID=13658 RepID=A0A915IE74_ROMCU